MKFRPVESQVRFPALEEEILALWERERIYEHSLARRAGAPRFVFYEGPPTANGLPHPGHCLTRAIKDLFPRYQTMRGKLCERKAGWDTHGLPVEVEVCKELGIHSKEEIERFGVEPFIHRCQESVFRYTRQWERLTKRLGFWVNLDEAYVTYHQSYVESVWWALKNLFDRGLLYQGHKIVWWWAQGGTALSSGEVGQGYREVADPSVYVRFPLILDERARSLGFDENTSLLAWTTTPWTLPSNQFAAVHPELDYVEISVAESEELPPGPSARGSRTGFPATSAVGRNRAKLIVAASLAEHIAAKAKRHVETTKSIKGRELVGLRYEPPFHQFWNAGPLDSIVMPGNANTAELYQRLNAEVRSTENCGWMLTFRVVPGDFVTTDSGTGVVHIAPAFGEVDYEILVQQRNAAVYAVHPPPLAYLTLINAVAPDGTFTHEGPDYCRGRWVKDCDKDIIRDLKHRGLLFHQEQYLHDYPFCWRAEEDPLIQYPRKSWFIKTTAFKDAMLANNAQIRWQPPHIQTGRFGNFLETNVDWALSRERYWGTPLPIWVCQQTGRMEAVASYADLLAKPGVAGTEVWQAAREANPTISPHLAVHKPYIDAITYDSPFAPGARMRRVDEVIDCWFDSGAMPFAQWGFPQHNAAQFAQQFPADFISEAIDQTRGWFYSLLAISTLLFGEGRGTRDEGRGARDEGSGIRGQGTGAGEDCPNLQFAMADSQFAIPPAPFPHPFRNCIVLGLMLGEDGGKMSKSKRNYREPQEIFERYGADALRWYFFANQPPWTSIRYSEAAIKESIPEFLLRLWNVYSFFVIYANIDGFDPVQAIVEGGGRVEQLGPNELQAARSFRDYPRRGELDRWIVGELDGTVDAVIQALDAYDNYAAAQRITAFVDALSNWYVRRSRDRFWAADKHAPDKVDAYWTLYECLLSTAKLVAPFVPFLADALWQNLAVAASGGKSLASVHLCDYPASRPAAIDVALSRRMSLVREIVSLGRAARTAAKLKVRQPLAKVEVILADRSEQPWLEAHCALIAEELNVKEVEFTTAADPYISYTVLPDLKRLGPRLGKQLPAVKAALAVADAARLLGELESNGQVSLAVGADALTLDRDDLQVRLAAKPGWAAAQGRQCVVVLSTEITPALIVEGVAREIVHAIQVRRKELDCQYTDRIEVGIECDDADVRAALAEHGAYIQTETLTARLVSGPLDGCEPVEVKIGPATLRLSIRVAPE